LFGSWLWSATFAAQVDRPGPDHVRGVVPLVLLGICLMTALTSAGDKAIAFTAGEVDLLFPGPFTRRQLLFYKLSKSTFAAGLTALILSFALRRYTTLWVAGYVGVLLSLLLVQLLSTALVLLGQSVSERAYTRGRQVVLLAVVLAVVIGVRGVLSGYPLSGPNRVDIPAVIQQFSRSPAGRILLAPFDLFGQTLTAQTVFPDLVKWGAQALLVDLLLLAAVVQLDANYLEAATAASQRRYERLRRVRSGAVLSVNAKATARRRLPQPPFLGGAGPIAWRQLTNAARSSRGLIFVLVILALSMGPFFVAARNPAHPGGRSSDAPFIGLFSTLVWLSIFLASLLKFDFRADLDPMETLKAMPLAPWAVALGQLVAPTVVLSGIHLLLIVAVGMTFEATPGQADMLAVAAALTLPFNLLLFASENLIFLLAPSRPAAVSPGDFQIFGRQIFTLIVRTLVVLFGGLVAAAIGGLAYIVTGRSLAVLTVVAGVVLLAETAALVPVIGWAFDRFDPSVHTPAA
jgi:hypothetical protein